VRLRSRRVWVRGSSLFLLTIQGQENIKAPQQQHLRNAPNTWNKMNTCAEEAVSMSPNTVPLPPNMYLRKPCLGQLRPNETSFPRPPPITSHTPKVPLQNSCTPFVADTYPPARSFSIQGQAACGSTRVRLLRQSTRHDWPVANATNFASQPIPVGQRGIATALSTSDLSKANRGYYLDGIGMAKEWG
jgi:hypothetical protein